MDQQNERLSKAGLTYPIGMSDTVPRINEQVRVYQNFDLPEFFRKCLVILTFKPLQTLACRTLILGLLLEGDYFEPILEGGQNHAKVLSCK